MPYEVEVHPFFLSLPGQYYNYVDYEFNQLAFVCLPSSVAQIWRHVLTSQLNSSCMVIKRAAHDSMYVLIVDHAT